MWKSLGTIALKQSLFSGCVESDRHQVTFKEYRKGTKEKTLANAKVMSVGAAAVSKT